MGIWDETAQLDEVIAVFRRYGEEESCSDLEEINQSSNFTIADYFEKHEIGFSSMHWKCGEFVEYLLALKRIIIAKYFLSHVITPIIAAFSIVTNSLSLVFFATKQRKQFFDRLFIFLNLFDLFLSILAVPSVLSWAEVFVEYRFFFFIAYRLLIFSTAAATTVLAFTRCLSVLKPFYLINYVAVWVVLAELIGICTIISVLQWYINEYNEDLKERLTLYTEEKGMIYFVTGLIRDSVLLIAVLIVLISFICLLSRLCNASSENERSEDRRNKYAATTVAILSVNFIVFNTTYACTQLLEIIYSNEDGVLPDYLFYPIILNVTVGIPLNSAINPAIYFIRNKKMREWLCGLVRVMREWLWGLVRKMREWLCGLLREMREWLCGLVRKMREWLCRLVRKMREWLCGLVRKMRGWLWGLVREMREWLCRLVRKMRGWLCGLVREIRGKLGCLLNCKSARRTVSSGRNEGTEETRM